MSTEQQPAGGLHLSAAPPPQSNVQKCTTFAHFLAMMNAGRFQQELTELLPQIAAALENHAAESGGKAKAKLKLEFDFLLKKGVYEIGCDHKLTLPTVERDRTIAWATVDNFFTPQNPQQVEMFGPRALRDPYTQGGSGPAVRDA